MLAHSHSIIAYVLLYIVKCRPDQSYMPDNQSHADKLVRNKDTNLKSTEHDVVHQASNITH